MLTFKKKKKHFVFLLNFQIPFNFSNDFIIYGDLEAMNALLVCIYRKYLRTHG